MATKKPLYETYRPKQWSEVVGQDKVIKQIDLMRKRGLSGRAYWISGQSGTGKTTIARVYGRINANNNFILRSRKMRIETIADLQDDKWELVTDSQEVEDYADSFCFDLQGCDGLFVKMNNTGDYTESIYGFEGIVPELNKPVIHLY
jgi:hypothetical protein